MDEKKHLTRPTQDWALSSPSVPRFWVWGQEEGEQKCWQPPWNDEQVRQPKCQQSITKFFLYTTSYKPIRYVFRTIVWLNLTGDWDIWHDMMWHDVTKGSGLEMMAVKREKAVNSSLPIHRISQCIQSLFETMGKIGKTHNMNKVL